MGICKVYIKNVNKNNIILGFTICFIDIYFFFMLSNANVLFITIIFLIGIALSLNGILNLKYSSLEIPSNKDKTSIRLLHIACSLAYFLMLIFMKIVMSDYNLIFKLQEQQKGIFVLAILHFIFFIMIFFLFFSIYSFVIKRKNYLSVIYHIFGVGSIMLYYSYILHFMTGENELELMIFQSGIIYVETILVVAFLSQRSKRFAAL